MFGTAQLQVSQRSLPGADSGFFKGAEVLQALIYINTGKTPGESQITGDLLKLLEKKILKPLTKIFIDIWLDPGKAPQFWRDAVVLNLFKKGSRQNRTITGAFSFLTKLAK